MSNVLNKVVVNKISKSVFDAKVASGEITQTMIDEEIWQFTDDQHVSESEKQAWNAKSNFSGSYNDLTDVPAGKTKLSEFENDVNFIVNTVNNLTNYYLKSESYSRDEVNALVGNITTMNVEVVTALPTENIKAKTIYLVAKSDAETNNVYDEYVRVNDAWEKIGDTEIDLSGYAKKEDLATVATSGSYNDLKDKPALFSGNYSDLNGKPELFSGSYNDLTDKPTLFSGSYNDLSDKPTIYEAKTIVW